MAKDEEGNSIGMAARELERRAMPRSVVDVGATLWLVSLGLSLPCRMVELGMGGCRMVLQRELPADIHAIVETVFRLHGIAFRVSGLIEWTLGKDTVGVSFSQMSSRRRDELIEVLCEVEAENAAKAQSTVDEAATGGTKTSGERKGGQPALEGEKSVPLSEPTEGRLKEVTERARPGIQTAKTGRFRLFDFLFRKGPNLGAKAAKTKQNPKGGKGVLDGLHVLPKPAASEGPLEEPRTPLTPRADGAGDEAEDRSHAETAVGAAVSPAGAAAGLVRRERRADPRYYVDTSSVITLVKIGSKLAGHIVDLSLGGCRIHTVDRFPVGIYTRVEIEFRLQGMPLLLGGVIQAIHDRNHVGIRFLDMSSRKREQVAELIAEIDEMSKAGGQK